MRTPLRVAILLLAVFSGCSGSQDSAPQTTQIESPFTRMPRGNEVPDLVFLDADEAFQRGDFVGAQRAFGTLFIIAPDYRGNLSVEAINATCDRIGVDCNLVFGRLEIMREVFYNRFGPIDSWVPAQRQDYFAILQCYENALAGNFQAATAAGAPVIGAPDPYFADSARRCVEVADSALAAASRQREADAALLVWFDNQPCMNDHRVQLLDAFDADEWERFVNIYPGYAACADALMNIIDAGILAGDPRLGMDHDVAWSDMSEIDAIMEDYAYTYQSVADALVELEGDPEYNRLGVQWRDLDGQEARLVNQIRSLETARDALTGGNRAGVEQQIANLQSDLVGIRDQKRDVMGAINHLRRDLGLDPRDRIYGTFGDCRPGGRQHRGLDIGGTGANFGLGTPVRSMVRARITQIVRPDDDPDRWGRRDTRGGTTERSGHDLPRTFYVAGYGDVHFFTRDYGSAHTGEMIITEAIGTSIHGFRVRYMHLGAAHPELRVGDIVEAGQEIGLMGGTAVLESLPHVHIDVEDRDGDRVDVAPLLGMAPDRSRCR